MHDLHAVPEATARHGGVSRRLFLASGTGLASLTWATGQTIGRGRNKDSVPADPFCLGVASGDPSSTGMVLWTRLAPEPLEPGGGLVPRIYEVQWELADDEAMKTVVRRGTTRATPQLGHSVHVELEGLEPDRWYWYRFRVGDAESRVGRTRTLPAESSTPERLRFAFASCQHYEMGWFTAYEHMAKDELDLVFHLGDYIYEGEGRAGGVRKHVGRELASLDDYRARYAQYRTDPHLQAMHARCPWFVTWDDHEVDNNYAGSVSEEKGIGPAQLLARRANAYQAYYEMMPLRRSSIPRGPHMRLYRKASFGSLAEFLVLDTRQYRTDQPNGDGASALNDAALDPRNTLLGPAQFGWLKAGLLESSATWNVLAQQVMMGMVDRTRGDARLYSMDQWPGYAHERMELLRFLAERRIPNPVVLTGDIHCNWVNNLRVDDREAEAPLVATEFVGTSITSGGNGHPDTPHLGELRGENPCVQFYNDQRGYVRCTVRPDDWRTDFVVVEKVSTPGAPAKDVASFVVEAGKAGAGPA
jgi:alkaline phosphatase D